MENNQTHNPIELAKSERYRKGLPLIDLSDGNPSNHGLRPQTETLKTLFSDYLETKQYLPDSRGLLTARCAIAEYYKARTPALSISPDNIFVVASTSEAYSLVLSLLCKPGDNVFEPEVTYPLFELIADQHSVGRLTYVLTPVDYTGQHSLETSQDRAQTTKAFFCISPHNPLGIIQTEPHPLLVGTDIPVIVDEVFSDLSIHGNTTPPLGTIYPDNPVFHLNGVSKLCGLPDFKLAWIALNDCAAQRYGEQLEFLNDIYLNASYPMQSLLRQIMKLRNPYQALLKQRLLTNMSVFKEVFARSSRLHYSVPAGGAMLFPRLPQNIDSDTFLIGLIEKGVYAHPGYYYNWERDVRLVISLLVDPSKFKHGIEILEEHLQCSV